jgi:small subunit ribosomal protein S19e
LEAIQVVKRDKKSELKKLSRVVTPEGQKDLNRIATQVALSARK